MAAAAAKRQDLPPEGGYRPINYKRIPPKTFFGGFSIIGGYIGMTVAAGYLFYLNCKMIHQEEIEMRSARLAIQPMLLAERDREYLKQLRKNRDEEAKLMANVEGWEVGTYYGQPLYKTLPKDRLNEPTLQGYYVHAEIRERNKRGELVDWS